MPQCFKSYSFYCLQICCTYAIIIIIIIIIQVPISLTETIIRVLLNLFSYEYFYHPQILCFKRKLHYVIFQVYI